MLVLATLDPFRTYGNAVRPPTADLGASYFAKLGLQAMGSGVRSSRASLEAPVDTRRRSSTP